MTEISGSAGYDLHLSRRIENLKRAAASARVEADQMLQKASGSLRANASLAPRLLSQVGGTTLRVAAGVVRRHPISAALIASVIVGTVIYHRRHRPH